MPGFGLKLEKLRTAVTRLAFLDDGAPSRAVLYSLLAVAALYKSGDRQQATRFIIQALTSLRTSAREGIGLQQGLHHILAGILICSFEVNSVTTPDKI